MTTHVFSQPDQQLHREHEIDENKQREESISLSKVLFHNESEDENETVLTQYNPNNQNYESAPAALIAQKSRSTVPDKSPEPLPNQLPSITNNLENSSSLMTLTGNDLFLSSIPESDVSISQLFNPDYPEVNSSMMLSWPWEKLQRVVELFHPIHLAVLLRKQILHGVFQPATALAFTNLSAKTPGGEFLLHDLSGVLRGGELCGIIAAPGKTQNKSRTHNLIQFPMC